MHSDRKPMHSLLAIATAVTLWLGAGLAVADEGKVSKQFSPMPKREYQTAQDSRCTNPANPKYCPALNWCCPYDLTHVCRGYRGFHEPYRRYGGGTFCVRPGSNEDWADLSQNCAVFVGC